MRKKRPLLTKEERDVLILCAKHTHDKHLSNREIAQRLGISVSRAKNLIHKACVKLGARNRMEAIYLAIAQHREISPADYYSIDEGAEIFDSLSPSDLRRIAHLVRQKMEAGHLPGDDEQIINTDRKQDSILTKREREVLSLTARGLTNKEIADRLCMSVGSVSVFLHRAYTKLGAHRRDDAISLALKQREITIIGDISSFNELIEFLALLEADSVEKIAQILHQKLEQEQAPTGS